MTSSSPSALLSSIAQFAPPRSPEGRVVKAQTRPQPIPTQSARASQHPPLSFSGNDVFLKTKNQPAPDAAVPSPRFGLTPVRILYNNDPHEKPKAQPHLVNAFQTLTRQAHASGRDVLRLNAGDNNIGRELDDWMLNVRLMNLMNYHATTLGNHELDLGSQKFAQGLTNAQFPVVVSNLHIPPNGSIAQRLRDGKVRTGPLVVRDRQGVYGIIGVTTPELKQVVSTQAKLEGEQVQTLAQTLETVRTQVRQLQQQGINKIIVLSHMGLEADRQLAQNVAGVDVIVGGHTHDTLPGIKPGVNYFTSPSGEPVLIVQAGKNARLMGMLDVLFDDQGRVVPQQNTLLSPSFYSPDPQATAIKNASMGIPKPLASIPTAYDAAGNDFRPDPVAAFTADTLRRLSGADIALVRSPEIRSNIDPGLLTDQDINTLMPFTDPVVFITATGSELINAFTRSARGVATHTSHPGMLNPSSNVSVVLDGVQGQVKQMLIQNPKSKQWEAISPFKQYSVALGEFTVKNHEFPELAHPNRVQWNSGHPIRNFFKLGLKQAGAPQRPIPLQDDGRLRIIAPSNPLGTEVMSSQQPSSPKPIPMIAPTA